MKKERRDLEQLVYRSIIRMMIENKFAPGEAILETTLSEEMGISRTPVKLALSRLVSEGFLEKKPKKGCFIPLPTAEDAEQVFQARKIIEGTNAELAAINATIKDIEKINNILKNEEQFLLRYDKEGYSLANEQFHFYIMKIAKNAYLERYAKHLFWRSNVYLFFFDTFYSQNKNSEIAPRQKAPTQHRRILKAIRNKEPEKAKYEMEEHVNYAYNALLPPRR